MSDGERHTALRMRWNGGRVEMVTEFDKYFATARPWFLVGGI